MISKRRDCRGGGGEVYDRATWGLHGGVCHRTSTPHKSGNKMKRRKTITQLDVYTNLFYLLRSHEIVV